MQVNVADSHKNPLQVLMLSSQRSPPPRRVVVKLLNTSDGLRTNDSRFTSSPAKDGVFAANSNSSPPMPVQVN
jgi:hypothetical protein